MGIPIIDLNQKLTSRIDEDIVKHYKALSIIVLIKRYELAINENYPLQS